MTKNKTLQTKGVTKKYPQGNHEITVLDDINLDVNEGEILGILGRSGSGKSTFLRIISDLIEPSSGEILYNSQPIKVTSPKISMIFQGAGLIPWLTIFDNVALGIEEQNLPKDVMEDKVLKVIHLVGLRGYEEAYPKEISGGMRQRVGFARALVVNPEVLLMDEAFSTLDYLTANSLKSDLLDLWFNRSLSSIKSIVIVTHSIEEAVELCDRVIVLSSNPGKIISDIAIDLPHPRDINSPKFHDAMESLYAAMTSVTQKDTDGSTKHSLQKLYPQSVSVILMFHFLETIAKRVINNKASIKLVAEELRISHDDLTRLLESLLLLNFIEIDAKDVMLSSSGNILLEADEKARKLIFKEHLVGHVSFIKEINHILQSSSSVSKKALLEILEKKFSHKKAPCIFNATISWARYADLFSYDNVKERLCLERPHLK